MDPRVKKTKAKSLPEDRLICLCNTVTRGLVEAAIRDGATTLGQLYDRTMAGVGACGGTCQPNLKALLDHFKATGEFPPPEANAARKKRNRQQKR